MEEKKRQNSNKHPFTEKNQKEWNLMIQLLKENKTTVRKTAKL